MRALSKDPARAVGERHRVRQGVAGRGRRGAASLRYRDVRRRRCSRATSWASAIGRGRLGSTVYLGTASRARHPGRDSRAASRANSRTGTRCARAFCSRRARCRCRIPTCSTSATSAKTSAWSTSSPTTSRGRACATELAEGRQAAVRARAGLARADARRHGRAQRARRLHRRRQPGDDPADQMTAGAIGS